MWTLTFVEKADKSSKVVNASLLNKTEHYLFKTRTKYIVFFIYIVTNIVMPCDSYTAKVTFIFCQSIIECLYFAGNLKKLSILKMDSNRLIELTPQIGK